MLDAVMALSWWGQLCLAAIVVMNLLTFASPIVRRQSYVEMIISCKEAYATFKHSNDAAFGSPGGMFKDLAWTRFSDILDVNEENISYPTVRSEWTAWRYFWIAVGALAVYMGWAWLLVVVVLAHAGITKSIDDMLPINVIAMAHSHKTKPYEVYPKIHAIYFGIICCMGEKEKSYRKLRLVNALMYLCKEAYAEMKKEKLKWGSKGAESSIKQECVDLLLLEIETLAKVVVFEELDPAAKATLVMLSEESREKLFADYLKEKGWNS